MEKVLRAKEMNQFLKRSDSTIYKLASKGEIPGGWTGGNQKLIWESKKIGERQ